MPDTRKTKPSPEKAHVEPSLTLGAGAFASPLAWPSSRPESSKGKQYRLTAVALIGGALIAAGIVGIALLLHEQRTEAASHAPRVALRAEAPAEMRARSATAPPAKKSQSATAASALKAAPGSTEATGAVAAQPTVHPIPVAASAKPEPEPERAATSSKRERERDRRKAREERKRSAAPPAPALPESLNRTQVIAAMKKVTPAVNACFGSARGKANVSFSVIGKTGRVVGAKVTGITGKAGSCIARTVRRARFPKFAKERLDISYPFAR